MSAELPSDQDQGRGQDQSQGRGRHLVVVGGGITGLAAARAARLQGFEVTVLEAGQALGGKLALGEVGGVQVDLGAESILARRTEGTDLAKALGLGEEIVHPGTSAAGVWSRGELRPLPSGQLMGVPGDLRALAATGILSDAGFKRAQADESLPETPVDGDISVGDLVAQRMGREVSDRLVEPLLGGVYAGRADRLSVRATIPQLAGLAAAGTSLSAGVRGLLAAAAARASAQAQAESGSGSDAQSDTKLAAQPAAKPAPVFAGLRGGVGQLPVSLVRDNERRGVEIRLGAQVDSLTRDGGRAWRLGLADGSSLTADAVLLAVPAFAAARLLAGTHSQTAAELAEIEYASVAIVTLAVPRAAPGADALPGSGFLVPAVDGRAIKAATFSSSKWPWLAHSAGDLVVLRASLGRAGDTAELERDDADLVKAVLADLAEAVGLRATPVDTHVQRWNDGLPQYAVGHLDRVARVRAALPVGIAVAGAAYDGVGIPACIASAEAAITILMDSWIERPTTDD
jgi:protoporphyrinogen/coproporphyrinogen III oxidase